MTVKEFLEWREKKARASDPQWKTAPISPTCEVLLARTPCDKPTVAAYPWVEAGWHYAPSTHRSIPNQQRPICSSHWGRHGRDIRSTRGGFQMHCVVYHALSLVQDRIEQTKTYRPCLQYLIETAEKENDIRFAPELKKEMGLT